MKLSTLILGEDNDILLSSVARNMLCKILSGSPALKTLSLPCDDKGVVAAIAKHGSALHFLTLRYFQEPSKLSLEGLRALASGCPKLLELNIGLDFVRTGPIIST